MTARALRTSRGFSLIELLVASAIILVVAAIATPSIVRSIRAYRVGSVGIEVSNILQRTRYEAIRRNIRTTCRGQVTGGQQDLAQPRELTNSINLKLIRIEPGEFVMGSTAGQPDEGPPQPARVVEGLERDHHLEMGPYQNNGEDLGKPDEKGGKKSAHP